MDPTESMEVMARTAEEYVFSFSYFQPIFTVLLISSFDN